MTTEEHAAQLKLQNRWLKRLLVGIVIGFGSLAAIAAAAPEKPVNLVADGIQVVGNDGKPVFTVNSKGEVEVGGKLTVGGKEIQLVSPPPQDLKGEIQKAIAASRPIEGTVALYKDNLPDMDMKTLWANSMEGIGSEARPTFRYPIKFPSGGPKLEKPPQVKVDLGGFCVIDHVNPRAETPENRVALAGIKVYAQKITTEGFELVVERWRATGVQEVLMHWSATPTP
jgi:hypothetical protein